MSFTREKCMKLRISTEIMIKKSYLTVVELCFYNKVIITIFFYSVFGYGRLFVGLCFSKLEKIWPRTVQIGYGAAY